MPDYDTITKTASQATSISMRQKIEAELILKDRVAKYNSVLPESAKWHGKHKPYGRWNEVIKE